jgi:hypothetical protein
LARAGTGDLAKPDVLRADVGRMLKDDHVCNMATEFGGNGLGSRQFEDINTASRERFPQFNDQLRSARLFSNKSMSCDYLKKNTVFCPAISLVHRALNKAQTDSGDSFRREQQRKARTNHSTNSIGARCRPDGAACWTSRDLQRPESI